MAEFQHFQNLLMIGHSSQLFSIVINCYQLLSKSTKNAPHIFCSRRREGISWPFGRAYLPLGLGLHKTNIIQSVKCTFLMRPNMYIYKTNWVLIAISGMFFLVVLLGVCVDLQFGTRTKKWKWFFVDVSTWYTTFCSCSSQFTKVSPSRL